MKIIKQEIKALEYLTGVEKVEFAGKLCKKMEHTMKEESAKPFITSLVKLGHLSPLEHCTVSFLTTNDGEVFSDFFTFVPMHLSHTISFHSLWWNDINKLDILVTTNLRTIKELVPMLLINDDIRRMFIHEFPFLFPEENDTLLPEEIEEIEANVITFKTANEINISLPKEAIGQIIYRSYYITTSRSTSQQIERSRLASYSEMSQRYCNFSMDKFSHGIRFIVPDAMKQNVALYKQWLAERQKDEVEYIHYIDLGLKPEDARSALPMCTATELVMTANLEEWKRIFTLRLDKHAQKEIQYLMRMIYEDMCEDKIIKDYLGEM